MIGTSNPDGSFSPAGVTDNTRNFEVRSWALDAASRVYEAAGMETDRFVPRHSDLGPHVVRLAKRFEQYLRDGT